MGYKQFVGAAVGIVFRTSEFEPTLLDLDAFEFICDDPPSSALVDLMTLFGGRVE